MRKDSKRDIYTFLLVTWTFLTVIAYATTLSGIPLLISKAALKAIWIVTRLFLLWKILSELHKRDIMIIALLLFSIISDYLVGGSFITDAIWFICGAKNIDIKKLVKPVFSVHLLGVIVIILMADIGLIENNIYTRTGGIIRYSMGFYHPNTFAAHIVVLVSMYMIIREKKMNVRDLIIILFTAIWMYYRSNSVTGFLILIAFLLGAVVLMTYNVRSKSIKAFVSFILGKVKYLVFLVPVLVFYIVIKVDDAASIFTGTVLSRVLQAKAYFEFYPVNLWGHSIELNYSLANNNLYTLDNSYLFLLLQSGGIIFLIFMIGEVLLVMKKMKEKEYAVAMVLIIYIVYGLSETTMIRFIFNFSLLFFAEIVWGRKRLEYGVSRKIT